MISKRRLVVHKFLAVFLLSLLGPSPGQADEGGQLEHETRGAGWAPHIWRSLGAELLPASNRFLSNASNGGLVMARLAKRTRFKSDSQTGNNNNEDEESAGVLSRQHIVDDQAGQLQRRQHLIESLVLQQSANRNEGEFWPMRRQR